jgi:hypothetical protein
MAALGVSSNLKGAYFHQQDPNYYFNAVMMPKRGRQNGSYYLLRYAFERLGDPLNLSI